MYDIRQEFIQKTLHVLLYVHNCWPEKIKDEMIGKSYT